MQFWLKWAEYVSKFILFHIWTAILKLNINFQFFQPIFIFLKCFCWYLKTAKCANMQNCNKRNSYDPEIDVQYTLGLSSTCNYDDMQLCRHYVSCRCRHRKYFMTCVNMFIPIKWHSEYLRNNKIISIFFKRYGDCIVLLAIGTP